MLVEATGSCSPLTVWLACAKMSDAASSPTMKAEDSTPSSNSDSAKSPCSAHGQGRLQNLADEQWHPMRLERADAAGAFGRGSTPS